MGWHFVRIQAPTWERLRDLQRVANLDVFGQTARKVDGRFEIEGLLSDRQIEQARTEGYEVEVLRDADRVARERTAEQRRALGQAP
jgi:hypothetical protein